MRIETAEGIHAGVEQQASVVAVRQEPIDELPAKLAQLLFALGIPEHVLAILAHGNVGMHAASVNADHRLRQEARSQPKIGSDLAADQLIELDLVGSRNHFAVRIVDLELR